MGCAVIIDGQPSSSVDAVVSVFDRGFLYGDSAFEVVRVYRGRPFELGAHLHRLTRSCRCLAIPPMAEATLERESHRAVELAESAEGYLRIVVTRGQGRPGVGIDPSAEGRRIVAVLPLPQLPESLYVEGVRLATVALPRALDGTPAIQAKASNYLQNILSLESARARGAYEAVSLASTGEVLEGATSNLFIVRGGRLETPPLSAGILGGITRSVVIRLARQLGVALREGLLYPHDLYQADEAFITSSIRELVPAVAIDRVQLGSGRPGPVYRRLRSAFRDHVRAAG